MLGFHLEVITGDTLSHLVHLVWSSLALPCGWKWLPFILFCLGLCIWPRLLQPFTCPSTLRFPLYLGECIQCCHDGWRAVSWNFGFPRIHAQAWDGWVTWYFVAECLKAPPYCSPEWMNWFTFPSGVGEFPSLHTPSSIYCCRIFEMARLTGVKWYLIEILICISLMIRDTEHLFAYFMSTWVPSMEKRPFRSLAHFSIVFF